MSFILVYYPIDIILNFDIVNTESEKINMDNKKQSEYSKAEKHLQATNWKYYLKACIKTGLESPTPYKVIPYKNGIGIKKIEFIK